MGRDPEPARPQMRMEKAPATVAGALMRSLGFAAQEQPTNHAFRNAKMSATLTMPSQLKSALMPLQGGPTWPVQPLNHAERNAKMSATVTPPTPLMLARQQVV